MDLPRLVRAFLSRIDPEGALARMVRNPVLDHGSEWLVLSDAVSGSRPQLATRRARAILIRVESVQIYYALEATEQSVEK
jgi:hypothetical protein